MTIIRPATPGFICTLVATVLLAVVSFCVPYFKSVFFLKASISSNNVNGTITFGTLGYCVEFSGVTNCSKPSVGYELDINGLVQNKLPFEIPQVAVKWITYALVLHIVALALSAGSTIFGLLAHVREMAMTCCSTCVSGFAAAVTLLAFIFDLALFFIAKARINAVGKAEIGNAIWLTLAAWVLLFFSGCFYTLGRCCISNRRRPAEWNGRKDSDHADHAGHSTYADQMRLDAVKAEADRKAAQKKEVGLPAFYETQPLTARVEGDSVYVDSYRDQTAPPTPATGPSYGGRPVHGGYAGGGYVQAPAGSRAVDEYYNPSANNSYPPQPHRQGSAHSQGPSVYSQNQTTSPPPINNQYLAPQYGNSNPAQYGHTSGGTTYHSAASHQQYPTNYSQYDPYDSQPNPHPTSTRSDPLYSTPYQSGSPSPGQGGYGSNATSYYSATTPVQQPERNYTLGGDGYGMNMIPPLPEHDSGAGYHNQPGAINTSVPSGSGEQRQSPVKGPRPNSTSQHYDDAPPGYEAGTSNVQGAWGKH